jgi:hypothetical protein
MIGERTICDQAAPGEGTAPPLPAAQPAAAPSRADASVDFEGYRMVDALRAIRHEIACLR